METADIKLNWSRLHPLSREDSSLHSRADISASSRDPAKELAILDHGLPPRRVCEYRKGCHLVI